MRKSEAALAWITRVSPYGNTQVLTQWSTTWQAFSLIGGHKEPSESFRECCIREIEEELHLCYPSDFLVSEEPLCPPIEYIGYSKRAKQKTQYYHVIFGAYTKVVDAIPCQPDTKENRWVSLEEIQRKRTDDEFLISEQVFLALKALEFAPCTKGEAHETEPIAITSSTQPG